VVDPPQSGLPDDDSVTTVQGAELTLPREELDRLWHPEYLERLARTYWRYLTRVSLGLLRVLYSPNSREIVLLGRPLVLLRFHAPQYETREGCGSVTWPIDRGLLVAPAGRGKGYLKLTVERNQPSSTGTEVALRVTAEVANFYPLIAGWGWWARLGKVLYSMTQLRIHVFVTHGFLRSLANLDLAPSVVGALRHNDGDAIEQARRDARGEIPPPAVHDAPAPADPMARRSSSA
jgi:hypothetical protein